MPNICVISQQQGFFKLSRLKSIQKNYMSNLQNITMPQKKGYDYVTRQPQVSTKAKIPYRNHTIDLQRLIAVH